MSSFSFFPTIFSYIFLQRLETGDKRRKGMMFVSKEKKSNKRRRMKGLRLEGSRGAAMKEKKRNSEKDEDAKGISRGENYRALSNFAITFGIHVFSFL